MYFYTSICKPRSPFFLLSAFKVLRPHLKGIVSFDEDINSFAKSYAPLHIHVYMSRRIRICYRSKSHNFYTILNYRLTTIKCRTEQTIYIKTVIKSLKIISTVYYRSDGPDSILYENCVKIHSSKSVSCLEENKDTP
jgi:hypothetical protein